MDHDRRGQPASAADDGERAPDLAELTKLSSQLGYVAGAVTQMGLKLGGNFVQVSRHAIEEARAGKPSTEVASESVSDLWKNTLDVLDAGLQVVVAQLEAPNAPRSTRSSAGPLADEAGTGGWSSSDGSSQPARIHTGRPVRNDDLRAAGMRLLQRSAALDDPDEHPAMSKVLEEMSPDEARIVRYLGETGPQAVITVIAHNPWTRKYREMVHNLSVVGREAGCMTPEDAPIYLDNLSRLGVVAIQDYRLRSQPNYDLLLCQPEVMEVHKPKGRLVRLKTLYKGVELSEFGRALFRMCFETDTSRLAEVPDIL